MKKINSIFILHIFFIFNILSFVDMFLIDLRVGLLSSIPIAILIMMNYKYFYLLGKTKNILFTIYIILSILSIGGYLINDRPIELYIKGISYNLLPSMLYIIGMVSAYEQKNILKSILFSNSIMLFVGLVIYFLFPEFYWVKIYDTGSSLLRFGAYIGSIQTGNIAVANIPLIFSNKIKINQKIRPILLMISILSIILSAQRSAYINLVAIALLLLIVNFKVKRKLNVFKTFSLVITLLVCSFVIYQIFELLVSETLKNYFLIRIIKIDNSMVTDRSGQWMVALDYFFKFPLGMGLGAGGDKASIAGMLLIPDGSYLRILVETGMFGIVSFIGTNIIAIMNNKASGYHKLALLTYLTAAIGSNVFDLYYSSFVYWVLLGYIVNEENGFRKNQLIMD